MRTFILAGLSALVAALAMIGLCTVTGIPIPLRIQIISFSISAIGVQIFIAYRRKSLPPAR